MPAESTSSNTASQLGLTVFAFNPKLIRFLKSGSAATKKITGILAGAIEVTVTDFLTSQKKNFPEIEVALYNRVCEALTLPSMREIQPHPPAEYEEDSYLNAVPPYNVNTLFEDYLHHNCNILPLRFIDDLIDAIEEQFPSSWDEDKILAWKRLFQFNFFNDPPIPQVRRPEVLLQQIKDTKNDFSNAKKTFLETVQAIYCVNFLRWTPAIWNAFARLGANYKHVLNMLETYYHYHMDQHPAHIAQMMQDQRQRIVSSDSSKLARWAMAFANEDISVTACFVEALSKQIRLFTEHHIPLQVFFFPPISSQAQYQQSVALDIWQRIYHELNLEQPDYLKYPPLTPSINTNRQQLVEQFFRTLPKPQELFVSWCREPRYLPLLQGLLNQNLIQSTWFDTPASIFVGEPQKLVPQQVTPINYKKGAQEKARQAVLQTHQVSITALDALFEAGHQALIKVLLEKGLLTVAHFKKSQLELLHRKGTPLSDPSPLSDANGPSPLSNESLPRPPEAPFVSSPLAPSRTRMGGSPTVVEVAEVEVTFPEGAGVAP